VVFLFACVLASSCITRTSQYALEVRRGASIEEKVERAKELVTEARLARLKVELRQKHADLTDAQLERIGVRWVENWQVAADGGKTNRSVTITVIMQEQPGANTAAVVKTAARILDAEINGPEYSAIDPK
jgi:hypothetical protein